MAEAGPCTEDHLINSPVKPEDPDKLTRKLRDIGIDGHVWKRKELESYFLVPRALCEIGQLDEKELLSVLDSATDRLRIYTRSRIGAERIRTTRGGISDATVIEEVEREFDSAWQALGKRLEIVPPKDLLAEMNALQQLSGRPAITAKKLAKALLPEDLDREFVQVMQRIEERI